MVAVEINCFRPVFPQERITDRTDNAGFIYRAFVDRGRGIDREGGLG